jgi:uncharacterized protein (TIGR00725 family)
MRREQSSANINGRSAKTVAISPANSILTSPANSTESPSAVRSVLSRPMITVFGSSQARRGGQLYAESHRMGKLLAGAGFDVMTGGYRGVMEAASRGAHAAGGQVTGITLERFRERVNPFVMREIRTASFYDRFGWLVDRADGYIAMHGGIGTLAEVTFAWQELLLDMVPPRPLILVGERWRRVFKSFRSTLIGPRQMYQPITLVATPEQALKRLLMHFPQLASIAQRA